jgi:DNA-binding MarR family transcriptional regulator
MGFDYTDAVFQIKATEFEVEKEGSTELLEYTSTDHAVLNALAHRAANDSGICWPGFGMIARDAHVSRSSVIRSIANLGELGFIRINSPTDERASNTYALSIDKLVAASMKPPKPKTKRFTNKKLKGMKIIRKSQVSKEELAFLDESKATKAFNIEEEDDDEFV